MVGSLPIFGPRTVKLETQTFTVPQALTGPRAWARHHWEHRDGHDEAEEDLTVGWEHVDAGGAGAYIVSMKAGTQETVLTPSPVAGSAVTLPVQALPLPAGAAAGSLVVTPVSGGGAATTAVPGGVTPNIGVHPMIFYAHQYFAVDHLGTVRAVYTVNPDWTTGTQAFDYEPFGVEITSPNDVACGNTHRFTGQERDTETGSDYFHARYYAGGLGRFVSPDKIGGKPPNPQSWNKYWYANDRPTVAIDPNGLDTYLLLVGRGYQSTDPAYRGQRGDVGGMFKKAAETREREIKASKGFDPAKDKVVVKEVGTGKEAVTAINAKYDSGQIKDIETFSHGGKTALNFGEGPASGPDRDKKWLTQKDIADTRPDLAPGATATFNACNSGQGGPGGGNVAQAAADQWQIPVEASPTNMSFDNPNPTTANPDVHMVPDNKKTTNPIPPQGTEVTVLPPT